MTAEDHPINLVALRVDAPSAKALAEPGTGVFVYLLEDGRLVSSGMGAAPDTPQVLQIIAGLDLMKYRLLQDVYHGGNLTLDYPGGGEGVEP